MPNRFITPEEAAKDFYNDAVKEVKKISPDIKGQKEELSKAQEYLLCKILNAFSRAMFYGSSPH